MRRRRGALTPRERVRAARAVSQRILRLPGIRSGVRVAAYCATATETSFAAALARSDIDWYLPVLPRQPATPLWFAPLLRGVPTRRNRYAIAEPVVPRQLLRRAQAMQFVLAPLLAFDRRGGRLGMGGGYYDATLAFLRRRPHWRRPTVIGIAFSFQEVERLPLEQWDVRLHAVVTEREYIVCRPLASGPPSQ